VKRLLSTLLIACSVALGTLCATNAYAPRLEAITGTDEYTLNGAVGRDPGAPSQPFARAPAPRDRVPIDDAWLTRARANVIDGTPQIHRVPVREFRFSRWDGKWGFAIACGGLGCAALLARSGKPRAPDEGEEKETSPIEAIVVLVQETQALHRDIQAMSDHEEICRTILRRVETLERGAIEEVVGMREKAIALSGLGGWARLMDRFASGERLLRRAWSAAADGHVDEAVASLAGAQEPMQQALGVARSWRGLQ